MSFRQPYQDYSSQRLLLVVLEDKEYAGSEYRHIRATVIRRAVPHKVQENTLGGTDTVIEWFDDHPNRCTGYRVASYVFPTKNSNIYVDDLQLRGQIDEMPNPLNKGRPYGNEVRFRPHTVDANTAHAISSFYKKYSKFYEDNNLSRRQDDFYTALKSLSQFLKVSTICFYKPGVRHAALSEANCFEEMHIVDAEERINTMLAPFYRPEE